MMKILISYFFGDTQIPLGRSCSNGFQEMGHVTKEFHAHLRHPLRPIIRHIDGIAHGFGAKRFNLSKALGLTDVQYRSRCILHEANQFKPDMLLVIRGYSYPPWCLREIAERHNTKIVGWCVKGPDDSADISEDAAAYDAYYCAHTNFPANGGIRHMSVLGVDNTIYHPLPGVTKTLPITFIAGHNKRRGKIVEELIQSVTPGAVNIWGPKWKRLSRRFPFACWSSVRGVGAWGNQLNRIYNNTKIVLNIFSWDASNLGGLNMRLFDVPATGSFLLTEYSDEIAEYFKLSQEIETWRTTEELIDKARYYLRHDQAREKIAQAGYERVLALPTFTDKMRQLLLPYFKIC